MSRAEYLDALTAAADMLTAARVLRQRAQDELDTAIASERDAALRCEELRRLMAQ
jgi:hypothetical protein